MKKLALAIIAMSSVACVSTPVTAQVMAETADVATIHMKTVVRNSWEITAPSEAWNVEETERPVGGMTQLVFMQSKETYGRTPIQVMLLSKQLNVADDGPRFSINVAHCAAEVGLVRSIEVIDIDGHPATVTHVKLKDGFDDSFVGAFNGLTGYVITCEGDRQHARPQVDKACGWIIKNFHLK